MDVPIPEETLTHWAETCLRMNHLGTLIKRELDGGSLPRAQELTERARVGAWTLFNELIENGAAKPKDFAEPDGGRT